MAWPSCLLVSAKYVPLFTGMLPFREKKGSLCRCKTIVAFLGFPVMLAAALRLVWNVTLSRTDSKGWCGIHEWSVLGEKERHSRSLSEILIIDNCSIGWDSGNWNLLITSHYYVFSFCRKQKTKAYLALQALETDLSILSQLQRYQNTLAKHTVVLFFYSAFCVFFNPSIPHFFILLHSHDD